VLTGTLIVSGCASVPELTTEQKLQDFEFLFQAFRDNHPFLFLKARVEGYDWLAHEAEFEDMIRQTGNKPNSPRRPDA